MEVRKVFKAGNSCVVSLPMEMLKSLGLRDGSHVSVEINRERNELILKPVVTKKSNMSLEFVRMVDKLFLDYEYVIRRLAK
ncbi:putative addiction module antidote [Anaerospora hongkongensis]|uniref:Putative addiction module antidote n=1 Tax=Anaerospora hongkongensis TaxID=244830 RepID=A0A4R1PXT0_9FIRM|nr:AbrB/MazE/SpoVT family DNA-binding domain-containing protein [Anaerospora hongkongensis]TCL37439.1 putative addiction module antidote [Anaerospora hongkongensis]